MAVFGETRSRGVIDFLMFSPLADFDVVMPIRLVAGNAALLHQLVEPGFDFLPGIIIAGEQQAGDEPGVASEKLFTICSEKASVGRRAAQKPEFICINEDFEQRMRPNHAFAVRS